MNILDYYSFLKEIEEDLKKQSKRIGETFLEEGISTEFISLHDGVIEENQVYFWQKLYNVVSFIILPKEKEKAGIVKNYLEEKKMKKIRKKLNWIISHFFEEEKVWNEENEKEEKNNDYLLRMYDKFLCDYALLEDAEESDRDQVIEDFIDRNQKVAENFETNVKELFSLWEGKK